MERITSSTHTVLGGAADIGGDVVVSFGMQHDQEDHGVFIQGRYAGGKITGHFGNTNEAKGDIVMIRLS